jgi:hypothetical protein
MRNLSILLAVLFFFGLVELDKAQGQQVNDLQLSLKSEKTTYFLGQPIPLLIELDNLSGNPIILPDTFDPFYGSLKFSVHDYDRNVNFEYMNPNWGILETSGLVRIGANEKLENRVQLLSRVKPDKSPAYFFQSEGTYDLRVSYQIQLPGGAATQVESRSIKIKLVKPVGENLKVWEKIKDNPEIGYFMQQSDFTIPFYRSKDRLRLQDEVEQLILTYPDSLYSDYLRSNLEKYRPSEEKRQFLRKKALSEPNN